MSKINVIPAKLSDHPVIQNMARFYTYEISRYCRDLSGWAIQEDGLYECFDLKSYFEDPSRHAFLVRVGEELAGFVLVNKIGFSTDVDWNMGEFFILAKFQGQGIGRSVATQILDQFPGVWEVARMPVNLPAIKFWRRLVEGYTVGDFSESLEVVKEPISHEMLILKFKSLKSTSAKSY